MPLLESSYGNILSCRDQTIAQMLILLCAFFVDLCFLFVCVHLYGQLLVPLAFLSYGTLLVRLFLCCFMYLCSVKQESLAIADKP